MTVGAAVMVAEQAWAKAGWPGWLVEAREILDTLQTPAPTPTGVGASEEVALW